MSQPFSRSKFFELLYGPQLDTPRFFMTLGDQETDRRALWAGLIQDHGENAFIAAKRHLDIRTYADFAFDHLDHAQRLPLLQPFADREVCGATHWPVVWTILEQWLRLEVIPQDEFTEYWPPFLKAWESLPIPLVCEFQAWAEQSIELFGAIQQVEQPYGIAFSLCDRLRWLEDPCRRTLLAACLGECRFSFPVDGTKELALVRHGLGVGYPAGIILAIELAEEQGKAPQLLGSLRPDWHLLGFTDGLKQPPARVLAEDYFGKVQWSTYVGIQVIVNVPSLERLTGVDVVEAVGLAVMHLFAHSILRTVPDDQDRLTPRLDSALEDKLVQTVVFRAATKRLQASFGAFCAALPVRYHLDDTDRQKTLGEIQAFLRERRIRPGERKGGAVVKSTGCDSPEGGAACA